MRFNLFLVNKKQKLSKKLKREQKSFNLFLVNKKLNANSFLERFF